MDFQQIRKYVKGVLTNSFLNKTTNPFELTSALKEEKEPETTRR